MLFEVLIAFELFNVSSKGVPRWEYVCMEWNSYLRTYGFAGRVSDE